MRKSLPLACLMWVLCALSGPVWATPEADARLMQEVLPGLQGRTAAARAATADAEAFFRGEIPLSRAFPDLALAPLYQPAFVADARRGLLAAAQVRANARLEDPPPDLGPGAQAAWRKTWQQVHAAEDVRDAAQGRLLAAIAAGLDRAPGLTSSATARPEEAWAKALVAGQAPDVGRPARQMASAAGQSIRGLAQVRRAALRQMAIPGDGTLAQHLKAELSVPVPGAGSSAEIASARARLDRVRAAAPLLTDPDAVLAQVTKLSSAMGQAPDPVQSPAGGQVAQAQRAAVVAQQRADAAEDASASAAQLQAMVADLRSRIASELQTEATRHSDAEDRIVGLEAELDGHRAALGAALSPLAESRAAKIHHTLRDARRTVAQIRAERKVLTQVMGEARDRWASAESDLQPAQVLVADPATAELARAIDDYRGVHGVVLDHLLAEEARLIGLLGQAKIVRDDAYSRSSARVRGEVSLTQELSREALEIPDFLMVTGRGYLDALRSLPSRVIEMRTLGEILLRLGQLVLLLGIWSMVRRRGSDWIEVGLAAVDPRTKGTRRPWESVQVPPWMVAGEVSGLKEPLAAVARPLADLILAIIFLAFLKTRVPVLGLLALVWVVTSLARLIPSLVNLCLITPGDVRPGLRVTSAGVLDRSKWTVRILVLWWGLDTGLVFLGEQVLDSPRMAEMAHDLTVVLLVVLALVGLQRWAPEIRAKISADANSSPLNNWLGAADPSILSATLRSAIGGVVLLLGFSMKVLTLVVEGRAGLGWLSAALARRQLKTDDETERAPLSPEALAAIHDRAMSDLCAPAPVEQIATVFAEWEGEHRQGMVALIGDRGMGKSRTLAELGLALAGDHRVVEIRAPGRLTDPEQALRWLAKSAGLQELEFPATGDLEARAEAVGQQLCELPETLYIVDDTHRLFLRSVGRFDALRAVLVAMQSCSSHHFWLCGFHGPSFAFLDGVRAVSHLAVFRARIRLEPVPPAALRTWLEEATAAVGSVPRYDVLLQRAAEGSNRTRMLSRTSQAYWRLLAEASQGNPDVALDYWLSGLRAPLSAAEDAVDVGLFQAPDTQDIEALGDGALFALTALILHDGATLDELHATLNLPEGEVRGTCRSLEAMGIIADEDADETYEVTNRWLPAVERLLRRKSFLHRR